MLLEGELLIPVALHKTHSFYPSLSPNGIKTSTILVRLLTPMPFKPICASGTWSRHFFSTRRARTYRLELITLLVAKLCLDHGLTCNVHRRGCAPTYSRPIKTANHLSPVPTVLDGYLLKSNRADWLEAISTWRRLGPSFVLRSMRVLRQR